MNSRLATLMYEGIHFAPSEDIMLRLYILGCFSNWTYLILLSSSLELWAKMSQIAHQPHHLFLILLYSYFLKLKSIEWQWYAHEKAKYVPKRTSVLKKGGASIFSSLF